MKIKKKILLDILCDTICTSEDRKYCNRICPKIDFFKAKIRKEKEKGLKSCPFCGNKKILPKGDENLKYWYCKKCGISTRKVTGKLSPSLWNRRGM